MRLIVPKKYAYKSPMWLTRITFSHQGQARLLGDEATTAIPLTYGKTIDTELSTV